MELEIGFGKGRFLVHATQQYPERNFLGIEIDRKYHLLTATRLVKRGITNARLCCGDARTILENLIPPASLSAIHIFFPDPWWKQRHHKRRLFQGPFVSALERCLAPGGWVNVATDVESYFHELTQLFLLHAPNLSPHPWAEGAPPVDAEGHLTNYEKKSLEQSREVFRVRYGQVGKT